MEYSRNFMQLENEEDIVNLIKRRRFQILVHSYIYYRLNDNIISNATFDQWANELIELQQKYPEISKNTELYDVFSDFSNVGDAASLPLDGDPKLDNRARQLLRDCRRTSGEEMKFETVK